MSGPHPKGSGRLLLGLPNNNRPDPFPPEDPVRFNAVFSRLDSLVAALDGWMSRWVPHDLNPLTRSGAAANLALIVAVASGILMLIWYSPSVQFAYSSLQAIEGRTTGGWVRTLHRYSSDLTMLLLFVHAGRTFLARKFAGSRWLPWVTGVAMMALIWFIGWTGYWLIWDQPAQQVAVSSMALLDALPVFGEPLGRLYVADRLVPSLLFFVVFFLHMLLPLGIAIGLALHLTRVSRAKLLPRWELSAALVLALMVASFIVPAPLGEPADMSVKAARFTVDAWYLTPLALSLRFQHAGLWVALFGTTAIAAAIPWVLGRRRPAASYAAIVDQARCHSCSQCSQDCPFDAITLIPRSDGKRFPSQASVNPLKCVGCGVCIGSCDSEGIFLPWFETQSSEQALTQSIDAGRATDAPAWVAFICGDIDGGYSRFQTAQWQSRLPGYQLLPVPNSSSVRPKFVEKLLRSGIQGVLVVRDAGSDAWSRDGGTWVGDRLNRLRQPLFRPERAGGGAWRVIDFDPSSPAALSREAAEFQKTRRSGLTPKTHGPVRRLVGIGLLAACTTVLSIAPSHLQVANPASDHPEFVLSFRALGDSVAPPVDAEADADLPIHMRGRSTAKPIRSDVTIRLTIDGASEERSFTAKGISNDGPAINEWRIPLEPGRRRVGIEIQTGGESEPIRWSGEIEAQPRRYHVVTFDSATGFRLE